MSPTVVNLKIRLQGYERSMGDLDQVHSQTLIHQMLLNTARGLKNNLQQPSVIKALLLGH